MTLRSLPRRLVRSDRGAALVEFAITLPLLLLLFAVVVEGTRLMWAYQTAIAGVRDAARYLARVAPSNICSSGGNLTTFVSEDDLAGIVRDSIEGDTVLPSGVQLDASQPPGVTATLTCVAGDFRMSPAPIATVSARVRIDFPFQAIFAYAADGIDPFIVTTVTDRTRVFGA